MVNVVKTIQALMDGCNLVRERRALTTSKREFISEALIRRHPIYIVSLDEEGIAHEYQPHTLGFYLSDLFIRDLQDKPLVIIVFVEGFDPAKFSPRMSAYLITDDEVVDFSLEDSFEISAVFALLKERMEIGEGGVAQ